MEDEQVIETLTPHTAQKAFTDGIRSWSLIRCFENLDPTRMCNPSEARPKLAIVLPKMVFRPLSIRRGFPKLLGSPSEGTKKLRCDKVKADTSPTQPRKKAVA